MIKTLIVSEDTDSKDLLLSNGNIKFTNVNFKYSNKESRGS